MNKIVGVLLSAVVVGALGCSAEAVSEDTDATEEAFSTSTRLNCESNDYRYKSCSVSGRIQSARVVRQMSSASCNQGQGWGFQDDFVWVDRGCRAEFEVQIRGGSTGSRRIRVTNATYGLNVGANYGNATYDVQRSCDGRSSCDYYISVDQLGDPAWGQAKDFNVEYSCNDGSQPRRAYVGPEANGQRVRLQCDGWQPPPPPPPPGGCGVLRQGQSLYQNQGVRSCNGRAYFVHQNDGNIVLYDGGRALAASHIIDSSSNVVTMQDDGNLVQYGRNGNVMWSSNTAGHYGAELRVQDDCNVVIYDRGQAIWHTNTAGCVLEH